MEVEKAKQNIKKNKMKIKKAKQNKKRKTK